MTEHVDFDPAEKAAIEAEYDRIAGRGQPINYGPAGCVVAILAVAFLGILPILARQFPTVLPDRARVAVLVVPALVALGGILLGSLGARLSIARVRARAERAIDFLARAHRGGDAVERRRAAVTALYDAFYSGGPWTVHTYDFEAAAARLGAALSYVQEVERVLRVRRNLYTVFTSDRPTPLP